MAMDDDDIFSSASRGWLFWSVLAGVIAAIVVVLALVGCAAQAHDNGRYAQSDPQTHAWFNKLASKKGLCCSFADGKTIADVDWKTHDGHYHVRIEDRWYDVPDEAVITEPNRIGQTMVWPYQTRELDGTEGWAIRCFMPGSMT